MDPISQGLLGAALPTALANKTEIRAAAFMGAIGGMAPDLDILIRSSADPLLHLEYHRHFTHSLLFIPFGSLIVALVLWPMVRKWEIDFGRLLWFTILGWATHAPLDACTSYGTRLLWPFDDTRFAWNTVAVVDPFLTVPLGILVAICIWRKRAIIGVLAFSYVLLYLCFGFIQSNRASMVVGQLALNSGHLPERYEAKPTVFNPFVYRGIYEYDGRIYVHAVRIGPFGSKRVYVGDHVEAFDLKKDLPNLDSNSQQAIDIRRFDFFSDGYLAYKPGSKTAIGDLRYAILPNSVTPLWGIVIDPESPDSHVGFENWRDISDRATEEFFAMILGKDLPK